MATNNSINANSTTPLAVVNGGTGDATFTAYSLVAAGTTSTGNFQSLASSTSGYPLVYKGASALPAYTSTPIITQILDTNSNELVGLTTVASAVNYVNLSNNSTTNSPIISAKGSDTNVVLTINGQGNSGLALQGTTAGGNASAGYVGELISSVIATGSATSLSNVTPKNVTTISLTAGDWDVWGNVTFLPAATTVIVTTGGWISSTNATQPDGSLYSQNQYPSGFVPNVAYIGFAVPYQRVSISSTTTIYLSVIASFTTSTLTACGGIYARRVR